MININEIRSNELSNHRVESSIKNLNEYQMMRWDQIKLILEFKWIKIQEPKHSHFKSSKGQTDQPKPIELRLANLKATSKVKHGSRPI